MKSLSRLALAVSWLLPIAASCAPGEHAAQPPVAATHQASARAAPSASSAAPVVELAAPTPARPPPPVVTEPLQGEPGPTALAEARLVAASCAEAQAEERKATALMIKQMRVEVDQALRDWAEAQPACWEQYRWRAAQEGYASGFGAGHGRLGGGHKSADSPAVRMAPAPSPSRTPAPGKAKSHSDTNTQVVGVDEADIVKTDGRYVYFAVNGALRIVTALKPAVVSVTPIPGRVREMFIEGDRAVVYASTGPVSKRCTYGYDCQFAGDGSATQILVYELGDRTAPALKRKIELTGSLMASRRIGNAVHTVVADGDRARPPYDTWPDDLQQCGTPEAVVRAKFARLKISNEKRIRERPSRLPALSEGGASRQLCANLLRTSAPDGDVYTTLVSFDLSQDGAAPVTATVQSRPGAVYASENSLYFSVTRARRTPRGRWYSFYPNVSEVSEIHKFDIGADAARTRYVGSGTVPGHVLNQFAMDEWYGYLRVATTRGRVPDPKVESVVSVLAATPSGNLVRVGAVEHMAPGEDIRSVRFDGDRGYVVTFKKTDPLFVIDLYQPAAPQVLGELKIPGFSTYLHRIDPDHLLSIGFDANDHGDFAYFDGVILQLFDVRVPTDPQLIHKEKIGSRGSTSEAATDHLAFNYFPERGLLAVPMTICEGGGDGTYGGKLTFSGLLVYDVNVRTGFKRLGGVDHADHAVTCNNWWSNANSVVKRSLFIDELVYSMTMDRVKVQDMAHFGTDVADIPFE